MRYLIIITFILSSFTSIAQQKERPVELGSVDWMRNFDEAVALSEESSLPILILFQEVPGCSTCTTYGHNILRHPWIVELIETHFVPLAIFNNKGGHDKKILSKFKEPAWNNPVVRIIGQNQNDLVSRLAGDYSLLGLSHKIREAMILSGQTIPTYLDIHIRELEGTKQQEEVYLSMYCFWTGEKEIAQLDGVLSTEAGYMHGREVVKVHYDASKTDIKELSSRAKKVQCADQVFADQKTESKVIDKGLGKYRVDSQDKYYLYRSKYKTIPMSALQATMVNSALGRGQKIDDLLSPRQKKLVEESDNTASMIGKDFSTAWYTVNTLE